MSQMMEFDLATDDFAYQLRRANQVVAAAWGRVSRDLTTTQYSILQVVDNHGPLDQKTLGGMAAVDRSTLTPLLDRLIARGLVSKRPDGEDRRRVLISLTAAGRRRAALGRAQSQDAAQWIQDTLGTRQLATVTRLLKKVADSANTS